MIKIKIDNIYSYINDIDNRDIFDKINDELSFYVSGYQFSKAFKNGFFDYKTQTWKQWDGKKYLATKSGNGLKFMTGLVSRVIGILKSFHVEYEIQDSRPKLKKAEPHNIKHIEFREYQDRVVNAVFSTAHGGIVKNCTASGKTVVLARLLSQMGAGRKDGPKVNVFVTGVDLLYQTHAELQKFLGIKIGIIGDGKVEIRNVNVASIWTCSSCLGQKYQPKDDEDCATKESWDGKNKSKVTKAIESADVFFIDECHMSATETVLAIRKASKMASFVVGLSGTPWRSGDELYVGDSLLIEAVCGEFIRDAEVTASELIHNGFLVQPSIHFINVPKNDQVTGTYQTIYKEYIVDNQVRNDLIIKATAKLVAMDKKVLILVKQIRHGEILLEQLEKSFKTFFVRGETDSDTRIYLKNEFEQGNIQVMIASVIFDTGINLPTLDGLILAGSGKASGRVLQRIGRILRKAPGKEKAIVIDFVDNCKYLLEHTAERIKIYRTEENFRIILPERNENNENNEQIKKKAIKLPPSKPGGELPW